MEYRLGICDDDYHYVVNLMEYVNSTYADALRMVAFSSIESIQKYLEKSYLDGVLVGCVNQDEINFGDYANGLVEIYLTEDGNSTNGEIYKYQSGEVIVKNIMDKLNICTQPKRVGDNAFLAVYSPLGRCGKTSLAKGLTIESRKSIYIGFEEFGKRDRLGEEILYHMLFKNMGVIELLEGLRADEYGLRQVQGIMSYLDIRHLEKENLEWLKQQLVICENYDKMVFDIGGAVLSDLNMLSIMDRIYVPVLEDEQSLVKLQAFREVIRGHEYRDINSKIQYINVPHCHYASDAMKEFIVKGELL